MEQTEEALHWMGRMELSARRLSGRGPIAHALHAIGRPDERRRRDPGAVLAGEALAAATRTGSGSRPGGLRTRSRSGDHRDRSRPSFWPRVGAEAGNRWIEAFALTEVHSLRAIQGEHLLALAGYAEVIDTWYRGGDWANQWLSIRRVLRILVELGALEPAAALMER